MSAPAAIYIKGPSFWPCVFVDVTVLLLVLKADDHMTFSYSGTICFLPLYILSGFFVSWMAQTNSRRQLQLREVVSDSAYGQLAPRTIEEEHAMNTQLMGAYLIGVMPTVILVNLKLDFPFQKEQEYSWFVAFLPFMLFLAFLAKIGADRGLMWWTDMRQITEETDGLLEQA